MWFDRELTFKWLQPPTIQRRNSWWLQPNYPFRLPQQSHRTLNRFPQLESLTNLLTIYYGQSWSGATQRGLVNFPITADKVPRLSYLDLTDNSLQNDDVDALIPQLLRLEQLFLEENNFSNVPSDLKNLFYLDIFAILLNDELPESSISP